MNEKKVSEINMSIYEQLQAIKEEMCDKYCFYQKEPYTLAFSQRDIENICERCPLTRL